MRDAIQKRISRRTYENMKIDIEKQNKIQAWIDRANAESGLNISLLEDGSRAFGSFKSTYGMFKNVRSMMLMKGQKDDPNLKEKIGYYGETLILDITDLGLGTCWVGGTFERGAIKIDSDEEQLICVILVGVIKPETFKERLLRGAMHRKMKSMEERTEYDAPMPPWFEAGMQAVLLAPSAVNSQKAKFVYKEQKVYAAIPDNYAADLIDLGIAKKHFEIEAGGKFEFGNPGIFHKNV